MIVEIAKADSIWNRDFHASLDAAYQHVKTGKIDAAIKILQDFLLNCPSAWYKSIANIEIPNLQKGECSQGHQGMA